MLRLVTLLLFAFLLAPVILVFPMSFSADRIMVWPPSGFSLRWYDTLLHETALRDAAWNSLILATAVTAIALAISLPAAMALQRLPGRDILLAFLTAPLLLPTIVLGLALLIVFAPTGLLGSWPGLAAAHLLVAIPYALRVVATALTTLPAAVEEAASSLGAPPLAVFRHITLPLIAQGLAAAGAITFLVSFDEVVISLFVVGPKLTTLPVAMFRYVESRTDPLVAAVSALLVLFSLAIVLALERIGMLRKAIGK
jgi:putative spermidine/putrescine transport system permease protein